MTAILLSRIRTDGGTQPRAAIDYAVVEEYANAIGNLAEFPPPVVFHDSTDYWLADGFHRCAAYAAVAEALAQGDVAVECDVRNGSRRDAILFSVGANAAHGLRRTNEDKRLAVRTLVTDPEWSQWSDHEIARVCNVSHPLVAKYRPRPAVTGKVSSEPKTRRFRTKHGKTAEMKTDGINAGRTAAEPQEPRIMEPARPAPDDGRTPFDWYAGKLRAIDEAVAALPSPAVTVRNFPREMSAVLTLARILEIQRWWLEFARLWAARDPEFQNYFDRFTKESA